MGFDAAGNFSRAYNYTQDRDNGIKILASHVDGEFDNFATAMNLVFFRDGRVPMSADLRLNINGIQGLKDGALGSPAIKFNTDANTGPYLDGLSRYAIGVNAVQRGVFTTSGLDVTGNLTNTGTHSSTGNITMGGNLVATQAFVTGAYAPLASPIFTGVPTAPTAAGGTNTTQLATTAFVQGAIAPLAPQAAPTFTNPVTINGTSGSFRQLVYATAGTNAAEITLLNDNVTMRHNAATAHRFDVGGTQRFNVNSTGVQVSGELSASAGTTGIIRFGSGGANNFLWFDGTNYQLGGSGTLTNTAFIANGVQGSYNIGFSSNRAGQVGYHMYNQGASTEWVMYQPAAATGHDFRIAMGAAGSLNDRFKIATDGNTYILGNTGVTSEIWVGGNSGTGVIRFGAQAGGTKYLYYDGSQFNFSASLSVGGNITSTSDARLKTNVRDLENGLAIVKAMRPKRFDMYGKADFGFVAQELQQVLPEAVSTDTRGFLAVDYGRLTAPLAAAIQSLNDRLDRAGL